MQAYAEGYELLEKKDIVKDVPGAFKAWSRGTVVRSWLLDLMVDALEENPHARGRVRLHRRLRRGPLDRRGGDRPLACRCRSSRRRCSPGSPRARRARPTMQAVAALRGQFGGHEVMTVAEGEELRARGDRRPGQAAATTAKAAAQGEAAELAAGGRGQGRKADQAGPSSGTGATSSGRTKGAASAGPTSGTSSTRKRAARRAEPSVHVRHLTVADFRSYTSAELPLEPGVTTLVGLNGQGKTNLVEALGYLATLVQPPGRHRRAARAVRRRPRRSCAARSCATAARRWSSSRSPRAGPTGPGSTARRCSRPRDVLGTLRTVLFAPEDLALVKGDPSRAAPLPRRAARRRASRGGRACAPTTTRSSSSATPC